jgi:arabinose-5-phosphate isomerase
VAWVSPAISARKIAATLASTGTPRYFVHPSEASHGDLGMITADDLVIVPVELRRNARAARYYFLYAPFAIPLVALVRRDGIAAGGCGGCGDCVACEVPEASPVGAPTTSTTMMLAWGDALAVALTGEKRLSTATISAYSTPAASWAAQFTRVRKPDACGLTSCRW